MKSINKTMITLGLISILLCSIPTISATIATTHTVTITTIDDTYSVEEKLTFVQDNTTIQFSTYEDATDLYLIINNTEYTPKAVPTSDYLYEINYTQGITQEQTTLLISYSYPKNEANQEFSKDFIYDTETFTLKFDQEQLTKSEQINKGSTITVQFPEKQDTAQSLNLYTTILIALLFVLLIVTTVYGFKKRKNVKKRNRETESTELLTTEKALLMSLLKEIEKKHRNHKISDETYEKLKTNYKQQTVDIMSNLED